MEFFTDSIHRIAYATDASAYREIPMAVAYPWSEEDIRFLIAEAQRRHTHLIPRAGGTSIAGQVVGSGIVVDISRYMNQILEVLPEKKLVRVQPGVVRDCLNKELLPYGLFFSPETSTSNRCCIGGMVGNNSCGTHSLIYGSTRHHVVGLRGLLADGTIFTCDLQEAHFDSESRVGQAVSGLLREWQSNLRIRQLLRDSFPDPNLRRRSCGYALDECLQVMDSTLCSTSIGGGLPALITGSEGTLAFLTEITLSLDELPPAHSMVVCAHLDQLDLSWEANLIALKYHPTAVELMDGQILELAKGNIEAEKNRFFVQGNPAAIVIAEFRGSTIEAMERDAEAFVREVKRISYACSKVYDKDVTRVWALRKAGLGVLSSMSGEAKPIGVIEDTAVSPYRMADYMRDFQQMMSRLNLDCVYYGHISTGELHLRPILDIKLPDDRHLFRQVATETALLVKKHKGSLSGEHGDGRLRGEFISTMYGEETYQMFVQLKQTWDPYGVFNVGKIVSTPPMDQSMRYDIHQQYAAAKSPALSSIISSLMPRIERCNGAGDCRKPQAMGGTMCPAYKATGDELMSTRARANILREKLTRDPNGLLSTELTQVLDSCLACKGCKSECPSNVDMTHVRSEILQAKYNASHTPFRSFMVARMAWVERIGSRVPHVYNAFAKWSVSSWVIKACLRFAIERSIPTLSIHSMRWLVNHEPNALPPVHCKGKVFLFADEFTNYQEAELGLTFVRMIRRLGYEVEIPNHVESGRAAISKGCLHLASQIAKKNVSLLAPVISSSSPLVGIEPSCILSFRDEYPRLVPESLYNKAERLANECLLYDEWLLREVNNGNITSSAFHTLGTENQPVKVYLHGHCHQKALVGVEKTANLLRMIPDLEVEVIPSGCCGMAGSFGYEKEHYEMSMAIGSLVLFPAVRRAMEDTSHRVIIAAPGISCREQIHHGTGVKAFHPIEILYRSLGE